MIPSQEILSLDQEPIYKHEDILSSRDLYS